MPVPPLAAATFEIETEAYQTLLARARRRTGRVPPELIARHVLAVTLGADWPVQRDALEALLRRFAFGRADQLRIVARPPKGRRLGLYATRRPGSPARPYRTLLRRIESFEGSCDCPDFLRSSLGFCKHLLTLLEDASRRAARSTSTTSSANPESSRGSPASSGPSRRSSPGSSTERPTRWRSSGREASSPGSSAS